MPGPVGIALQNEKKALVGAFGSFVMVFFGRLLVLGVCLLGMPGLLASEAEEAFFESKIRPVLVEHCYDCHSEEHKIQGGLRLDHRGGWEVGGESGAALVPHAPERSLLMVAVGYEDLH